MSHLCYCYLRLGKAVLKTPMDERIILGLFFCSNEPNELLKQLRPEWDEQVVLSIEEKCSMFNAQYSILNVFPWKDELSDGIDHIKFSESFFVQPSLFLRLRPGKEQQVKLKLKKAGIDFKELLPDCLELPNSSKVESGVELNKEAVIQDFSSQRVAEFLLQVNLKPSSKVWDCCAASGGKSIMASDVLGDIDLTVSDIRESILVNLKKRFHEAGIKKYNSFVADLTTASFGLQNSGFDLIICDAPCTGSGTWSRTPEQLYYFEKNKIDYYTSLQKKIVSSAIPYIKPGGFFLYITCSVFKRENEEIVSYINENFHLKLMKMEILKGYDKKADTMFAALLQKPL